MTAPAVAPGPAVDRAAAPLAAARAAVAAVFGEPASRSVAVRYWDGSVELPGGGREPRCTVVIPSASRLRRALLPPSEIGLAEAFVRGDLDVDGDIEVATAMADDVRARLRQPRAAFRALGALLALPRAEKGTSASHPRASRTALAARGWRHTRHRDRAAVRAHYDVGNDFYALWLDGALVYSCAYYPAGDEDIDAAQRAKLDLICRKLRLREGERLLDIGCGWGGLIRHAAREYGVRALGITLSERQAELARERIAADGLTERCRVEVRDYRDLPADATFDKVVSVGMFEHVGRARMSAYFRAAARLTRPGGLFLNHGIVQLRDERGTLAERANALLWRRGRFIDRWIFPDGELVPLPFALRCAEQAGFETRDVESLREHYARTLRQWRRRLEASQVVAEALAGTATYRAWRLYLAGAAHAFARGWIGLSQMLLARPDARGRVVLPRSRADLYETRTGARPPARAGAH